MAHKSQPNAAPNTSPHLLWSGGPAPGVARTLRRDVSRLSQTRAAALALPLARIDHSLITPLAHRGGARQLARAVRWRVHGGGGPRASFYSYSPDVSFAHDVDVGSSNGTDRQREHATPPTSSHGRKEGHRGGTLATPALQTLEAIESSPRAPTLRPLALAPGSRARVPHDQRCRW